MTEAATPEVTVVTPATAETVVVDTSAIETTPAEQQEELLAGKFKTPADLEKAYKELETKLGGNSQQPAAEETPAEETNEETPEGDEANNTEENPYGEVVSQALDKAGLSLEDVAKEYTEGGKLGDETYGKLDEAGFPQAIVDAYLRGVAAEAAQAEETATVTEAQIVEIKAKAGGDEGFAELTAWMQANVEAADLDAYNEEVSSGDAARAAAAVESMAARKSADTGTEPSLIGGKNPGKAPGYGSEAEWLADMAKPEYKTNAAFREQVEAKLAASPGLMLVA